MPIYKNPENDDTENRPEGKPGWVEITHEELLAIVDARTQKTVPPPTVAEQLAQLDTSNMLTQRNLREAIMLLTTAIHTLNPGMDLTQIPGVAKVFEVEAQAEALRAQL